MITRISVDGWTCPTQEYGGCQGSLVAAARWTLLINQNAVEQRAGAARSVERPPELAADSRIKGSGKLE